MFRNNLVIIPCNAPWEWSTTDYISQTAKILGHNNFVLCLFWLHAVSIKEYIIRKEKPKLFFQTLDHGVTGYYFFHILPFRRFKKIHILNIILNLQIIKLYCFFMQLQYGFQRHILWFFDPVAYEIVTRFGQKWFKLYDCIDYVRGDITLSRKKRADLVFREATLIRSANLVTVNSKILYKLLSPIRPDIYIVPQGFRLDSFRSNKNEAIVIPHYIPIVGYIGAINYRLDYRLLVAVAKHFTMLKFVFVGPTQEEEVPLGKIRLRYAERNLFSLPNVLRIQGVGKKEVPGIIAQFDIGMIPYDVKQDFNRFCYPMKLFEYFYLGKPVMSTPIEELKRFPEYVKIGSTAVEWEKQLRHLLNTPWPISYKNNQRKFALNNTWKRKIEMIGKVI